jgi:hypothetical protein
MKNPAGQRLLIFIALALAFAAGCFMLTCSAQVSEQPLPNGVQADRPEITVDEELKLLHLPLPLPEWLGKKKIDLDPKRRPLLAFRAWAGDRKPFLPSFLFCFGVGILAWSICPGILSQATAVCRGRFWRSLFAGILSSVILLVLARCLFISEVGTALANLTVALLEFALLLGASVTAAVIGESVVSRTGLSQLEWLKEKRVRRRLFELAVGSLLFGALLAIPGAAGIPPIGIRVAVLLCQLGLGSCLYVYNRTRTNIGGIT